MKEITLLLMILFRLDKSGVHSKLSLTEVIGKRKDRSKFYSSSLKADEIKAMAPVDIWLSSDGIPVVNHDASIT